MRNRVLTHTLLLSTTVLALLTGCEKNLNESPVVETSPKGEYNDFATLRTYTLNVKYDVPEGYSVFLKYMMKILKILIKTGSSSKEQT
ncbi:hypothetical protein [Coprobacter sp.]